MRILQVCNKTPYPLKDGGAMAIYNMAKGFGDSGHDVDILAMHTRKHAASRPEIFDHFETLENIKIELFDINTDIRYVNLIINYLFSEIPYNASRFISKRFGEKLIAMLKNKNYDIVQFEGLYLAPYAGIVREYSPAKLVMRAHNVEHEIWKRYALQNRNLFKKHYMNVLAGRLERFEKKALHEFDILVPITGRDNNAFLKMGFQNQAMVCPYGYDTQIHRKNRNNDLRPDTLFFIGSLDWLPNREGLLWFIKWVWQSLHREFPSVTFSVAGRNAPQNFIERLRKHAIDYAGEVENAAGFMAGKAVMVVPLFSGSGMRVKIVEAMAMGRTVLTTSIGAEGLDVSHNVHLLLADDPAAFLNNLKKLLHDPGECLRIGKNAEDFVKIRLDNKKIISGLLDFYSSIITRV